MKFQSITEYKICNWLNLEIELFWMILNSLSKILMYELNLFHRFQLAQLARLSFQTIHKILFILSSIFLAYDHQSQKVGLLAGMQEAPLFMQFIPA